MSSWLLKNLVLDTNITSADVAELVDAVDSKSTVRKDIPVQVRASVPLKIGLNLLKVRPFFIFTT